ncbi:MAG: TIGR04283 family arsenosugar biosynthesis glycosyltransferase [Ghiorsea sp.]|nr:TIGR04283 family arsenosugar biosynthesis glycosyltransferase [Ghiorsea sp.]
MQKDDMPSLAIVVPVFNEEKTLSLALKKLQHLNIQAPDEILFVDGGSTDNTKQIILDAGFQCLKSAQGRAKQMNFGAENIKGKIILFLHIDTSISSSNILNIKKTYKHGFLSGRFNVILSNTDVRYRIISFFINVRSRLSGISTGDQTMFVTRVAFEQVGGFPDFALMEDVALSKKLKPLGKVACLKDTVTTSSRRWEQHGVVKTVLLMWKLRFLYWLGVSPERLAKMYRSVR